MDVETAALLESELRERVSVFARSASLEISPHDERLLPALQQQLRPGTTLYVTHPPGSTLDQVVRVALEVEACGFRASPHIVARRVSDRRTYEATLRTLRAGGVKQVLIVAGDRHHPLGIFSDTLELLATGQLEGEGFERVAVCGHPEGNTKVGAGTLRRALADKQVYATHSALQFHIVTQFGFDPAAICSWDRSLAQHGIFLPVHVGIAGPTPLPQLIKFAMRCGVGASLQSLVRHMSSMSNLPQVALTPEEMLLGVIRGCASNSATRIVQPHFYSFGGLSNTARWLRPLIEGRFNMPAAPGRFTLRT